MMKILYFCLFVSAASALAVGNRSVALTRLGATQYYISSDAVTFIQAWAYCENYGMKFISFGNEVENTQLIQTLDNMGAPKPNNFWIGGIYLQSGLVSKWYWVNGDTSTYSNWYSSSRITTVDNCIRLDTSTATTLHGKWTATNCAYKYKFICGN